MLGSNDWKNLQEKFLSIASEKLNLMEQALSKKDFSLVQLYAHQLKGSGASFGFDEVTEIAGQIEVKCMQNSCEEVIELVKKLNELVKVLKSNLQSG
ncbi:Hpt domain-containing protein [Candidatus Chrysopegis kryptomonas]|jgi:hypothetical protein|uniref:Hpt domain-containing protein n=1 Tax=Candidatus Chryseopegocella kryptomonas TaxID=1633643 RepID=A0A0P1NTZ9_9BACT|nr:Hpt domain-containing protein [Candidatus Chrysopegis kryptomonas]CUT02588.1 Hpt domain-containing protein [Candidatus Chrysopegis kryptomonas]